MTPEKIIANTIDEYIAYFPADVQQILQRIRAVIHETAPQAVEAVKYGVPTFVLHGNLVHFGGYRYHIGFYPASSGISRFQNDLTGYKQSKGTVQFPLDRPIPYDLIRRIVEFRVAENLESARAKKSK